MSPHRAAARRKISGCGFNDRSFRTKKAK
jgi:hypothetical protein